MVALAGAGASAFHWWQGQGLGDALALHVEEAGVEGLLGAVDEFDEVVLEVRSPVDGVLERIAVNDGDTVKGGDLLALLQEGKVTPARQTKRETTESPPPTSAKQEKSPVTGRG